MGAVCHSCSGKFRLGVPWRHLLLTRVVAALRQGSKVLKASIVDTCCGRWIALRQGSKVLKASNLSLLTFLLPSALLRTGKGDVAAGGEGDVIVKVSRDFLRPQFIPPPLPPMPLLGDDVGPAAEADDGRSTAADDDVPEKRENNMKERSANSDENYV